MQKSIEELFSEIKLLETENQAKDAKDNPSKQAEARKRKEIDQILVRIIRLTLQAEEALKKGDLKQANSCLVEIKSYAQTEAWQHVNQATINNLESRLARAQARVNAANERHSWPLIIGSVIIIPLALGMFALLIKKWVKAKVPKK